MRLLPAGPGALLVELGSTEAVLAFAAEVERRRSAGWDRRVLEVVPGATTVLLDGLEDPRGTAEELARWTATGAPTGAGPGAGHARTVEVPCRYGGPDLAEVAAHWGVAEEDVPAVHAGLDHRVAFCGFAPGFAYIAGLGQLGGVPRLATPRPSVPAGSVALAGDFTGVYPRSSPGGWRIIGHTDAVLWDPARAVPALLAPGVAVRFLAV